MLSRIAHAVVVSLLLVFAMSPAVAERRLALVVGIDAYASVPPLKKAVNDARSVAKVLANVGFEIIAGYNLTQAEFAQKLDEFERRIQPGDTALFFFSGHGIEIRGQNYLLPADVPQAREDQDGLVSNRSFAAVDILERAQDRKARALVFILDACRNNPFERPGTRSTGTTRGLARVETPPGVFVMLAAGVRQLALDRLSEDDPDPNSVFTRVFLKELKRAGAPIRDIAKSVQTDVERLAKSIEHQQTPAYYDQIVGEFYVTRKDGRLAEVASAPQSYTPAPSSLDIPRPRVPPLNEAGVQCDKLAASPHDRRRPTSLMGVQFESIDARGAIAVCHAAVRAEPASARFRYQLGRAYQANKDYEQARLSYQEAARQGYAAAKTGLGELYRDGLGTSQDLSRAALSFQQVASSDPRAQTNLGLMLIRGEIPEYGRGSDESYRVGRQLFEQAFTRDDDEAAFWLGVMYYRGRGVRQDYAMAQTYFKSAAEAGHRRAMLHLGSLYRDWDTLPKHYSFARVHWERASQLGSPQATHNLGEYYENGWGGRVDIERACYYYEKASEMGQANSWSRYIVNCFDIPTGGTRQLLEAR